MSEPKKRQTNDIVIQLDAERRREIDGVKQRMENFLATQIELKHAMEVVASKQDQLKERFEVGTARTLKELKDSFDAFRLEWGTKKAEDTQRDKEIKIAKDTAISVNGKFDAFTKAMVVSLVGGVAVIGTVWAIKAILIH